LSYQKEDGEEGTGKYIAPLHFEMPINSRDGRRVRADSMSWFQQLPEKSTR